MATVNILQEIRNAANWRRVQKKQYEAYFCIARSGIDVHDFLERKQYKTEKENNVIYSGVLGERRVVPLRYILENFVLADGTGITKQEMEKRARVDAKTNERVTDWIRIRNKSYKATEWAFHIAPKYKNLAISKTVVANVTGSKYSGCGDFLVAKDAGGVPDFHNVELMRGDAFTNTYDMRTFPNVNYNDRELIIPATVGNPVTVNEAAKKSFDNMEDKILALFNSGKHDGVTYKCMADGTVNSNYGVARKYIVTEERYGIYCELLFLEKTNLATENLAANGVFMCGGYGNIVINSPLKDDNMTVKYITEKVDRLLDACKEFDAKEGEHIHSYWFVRSLKFREDLNAQVNIVVNCNNLNFVKDEEKDSYIIDGHYGKVYINELRADKAIGLVEVRGGRLGGSVECLCNEWLGKLLEAAAV